MDASPIASVKDLLLGVAVGLISSLVTLLRLADLGALNRRADELERRVSHLEERLDNRSERNVPLPPRDDP